MTSGGQSSARQNRTMRCRERPRIRSVVSREGRVPEARWVEEAETVTLSEDTGAITVRSGEMIRLDLNGKTIYNSQGDRAADTVEPGGYLYITGTGQIINAGAMSLIFNEGECIIDGAIEMNSDSRSYTVINHGTMLLSGGVKISCSNTCSSLLQNGYYEYGSGSKRTGHISGAAYPLMLILSGTYEGGRISVKNADAGICRIYGGEFCGAENAVLKNWADLAIYGGEFRSGKYCLVLAKRIRNGDRCLGVTKIYGGTFEANPESKRTLIVLSEGTDYDRFPTHGETYLYGGSFRGFEKLYGSLCSPRAVLEISEKATFTPKELRAGAERSDGGQ